MKKIKKFSIFRILYSLIISFCIFSCLESDLSVTISSEQDQIDKLSKNENFVQYVVKMQELLIFDKKEDFNSIELISDFSNINSINDFYSKIRKHYKYPEDVIKTLEEINTLTLAVKKENKNLMLFNHDELDIILNSSVNKIIIEADKKSKNGKAGQCEAQMASDKDTCFSYALIGAATCGLTLPTLIGAAACYAGVMAADIVCHTQAENNYKICKEYSTGGPLPS